MESLQEEDGEMIHVIYVVPPGDKYRHQVYRLVMNQRMNGSWLAKNYHYARIKLIRNHMT